MSISTREINLKNISQRDLDDWNRILESSKGASIFHTPEWVRFIVKWGDPEVRIIMAYDNSEPLGIFVSFVRKTKYVFKKTTTETFETPYGGPVVIENTRHDDVFTVLIKKMEEGRFLTSVTIKSPPSKSTLLIGNDILGRLGYQCVPKETMLLELDDSPENTFSQMHQMKRRNIRKAEKNDISVKIGGMDDLQDFHIMLTDTYERLGLGSPKPIEFYRELFSELLPLNRIRLSLAILDGEAVASAIFLIYGDSIIFWQGASYREYMKFGPNDLLHWDIIKYGLMKGFNHYNLLHFHDDNGNILEPLRKFKEGFGSEASPYYIYKKKNRKGYLKWI